jgi:aminopeptidase N
MDRPTPKAVLLSDYRPPAFLIDRVELDFTLEETATVVAARLAIRRNPAAWDKTVPLTLDGQKLELISVAIDGAFLEPTAYTLDDDRLTILDPPPGEFHLETVARINPKENTALEGLYVSSGNFCTQCEPEGFRKITWFIDRPDVMAKFTVTIDADAARCPVLLSNGNLVDQGKGEDGRHWTRWEDPFPKPSYLFALVAGKLVPVVGHFRTASGRHVQLRIYVEPGNEDKCDHAMRSLKKSMAWDEEVYGLEYDLDVFNIVAVGDFNMGAMENKSLNVFNTKYVLARPETATDGDFLGIEAVVAHEYFHNWTGNRVTCRDWFQLSLKEGLTVFRDQQFSADMNSAAVKRIGDVQGLRTGQFQEDAGAMSHPVRPSSYMEINNFYTATVYSKGAEVIRMMHTLLGAEAFRKGMDLYFERHDGQAVTCDDFAQAMEDASGVDLGQFRLWYSQSGTPQLAVTSRYDADSETFTLDVEQTIPPTPGQPTKQPMHIPLAVGLLGPDGADLRLTPDGETTVLLHVRRPNERFVFPGVKARPVPSLLRGFSAPVKLATDDADEDLAFRLAHDSDPFNRWEAGQALAVRVLLRLVDDVQQGRDLVAPPALIDAVGKLLADSADDPAFAAQAVILPGEGYIANQMAVVDPDAVHKAREFLRRSLGQALGPQWSATYRRLADHGPFKVDADAIGRRSLKNIALAYLMAAETPEALGLTVGQYYSAASMTDSIAALQFLANSPAQEERAAALDDFYQRWKDNALVVDKWLGVLAMSYRPDTLETVKGLLDHPAFNIRNPNKVYALIGSFANANAVRFHAADGSGYRFLADQVLTLDPMNPQVAARMMGPFSRAARFDKARQGLMKAEMQRVAAALGLSPDVAEVTAKSLAHLG